MGLISRVSSRTYRVNTTNTRLKMLYLIGLGLSDAKDVSIRGLELIKAADKVYLEAYTSILLCPKSELEQLYQRTDIIEADRTLVEQASDEILENAKNKNICFLVIGDPLSATTHTDLILRAVKLGIKYEIVHNASIMNAIATTGLHLYNFGETISVVFWEDTWKPTSYFDKILKNFKNNYHTLCLLDIKMKEQSVENLIKQNQIFEPPRWMTCQDCANQFLEILNLKEYKNCGITCDTKVVGVSKVGSKLQKIFYSSLKEMAENNYLGEPLHSLVVPHGNLHELEIEFLSQFIQKPDI